MGLNKISGIYDYSSEIIQKYKSEIAQNVKDILSLDVCVKEIKIETSQTKEQDDTLKKLEETTINEDQTNKKNKEFIEATKFINFAENVNVKVSAAGEDNKSKKRNNNNKIKKVDFDFNFDNFNDVNFSSFGGETLNNNKNKKDEFDDEFNSDNKIRKCEEEEENSSYKPKISKEEINKKFANKKAISSDDYARLEDDPSQNDHLKSKINSMKYSKAISSNDLYGEPEEGIK